MHGEWREARAQKEHCVWGWEGSRAPHLEPLASHAFLLLTAIVNKGFISLFPSFSTSFCHGGKKRIKD